MSRRGKYWDNAVAESFFNLLKRIRRRKYKTRKDPCDYNPQRKHLRKAIRSQIAFEQQKKNETERHITK